MRSQLTVTMQVHCQCAKTNPGEQHTFTEDCDNKIAASSRNLPLTPSIIG
jgi:hypothetical protein